MKEQNGKTFPL